MNYLNRNEALIEAVWQRGVTQLTHHPSYARKDRFGNWIVRSEYGQQTQYGWQIDHVIAQANGGSDHITNLAPLFWRANASKGDRFNF